MTSPTVELLTIGETMLLVAPERGQLVLDSPALVTAGGADSNVAIEAARRGIRSAWCSRVGSGALGKLVIDSVSRWGVDTHLVDVDDRRPTGLMVKQPAAEGSQVFYYRSGSAASALSPAVLASLPASRIVHTTGVTAALSASAHALVDAIVAGALSPARVSFDVNYRPALWSTRTHAADTLRQLARRADIVFVGRDEAEALWGTSTAEDVRALLPDVSHLIVKDGDVEAVEFQGAVITRVAAQTVEVVEPVGAGDAFAGAWLSAYLRGAPSTRRLSDGHASAAAALRSPRDQSIIHPLAPPPTEEFLNDR